MAKTKGSDLVKEKLELLKLLADETRLEILNILLKEDSYVEKIACELSLTPATICYHLKKILIRSFNRKNISFSFIVVMAYHEKSKFSDSFSHKMFYLALTLM